MSRNNLIFVVTISAGVMSFVVVPGLRSTRLMICVSLAALFVTTMWICHKQSLRMLCELLEKWVWKNRTHDIIQLIPCKHCFRSELFTFKGKKLSYHNLWWKKIDNWYANWTNPWFGMYIRMVLGMFHVCNLCAAYSHLVLGILSINLSVSESMKHKHRYKHHIWHWHGHIDIGKMN